MLKIESTQKKENDGKDVSYHLIVDKVYTVGRKQGDITLPDDQSISRLHAELQVEHPPGNLTDPLLVPSLKLTDSGSKFGSFATENSIKNKIMVPAREAATLSIGEKLKFGLQWNEFRIAYTPLVVTTSSMKTSPEFKEKIRKLGGHLLTEWNSHVTHVVMESVSLTVKVVCALLAAKPIVTPVYITDLLSTLESANNDQVKPLDVKRYLPPVTEKGISDSQKSSFYPNSARTTLFAGKTFLFCSTKHMKKMVAAIEAGGGSAELITTKEISTKISNPDYIVMAQPSEILTVEKDPNVKHLLSAYKKSGKRYVADSELGLAALHNTIDKFCNPRFVISNAVLPSLTSQSQSSVASSVTLVSETQEMETQRSMDGHDTSRNIVKETFIEDQPDNQQQAASPILRGAKRPLEPPSAGSSSTKKRPAAEPLFKPPMKRVKDGEASKPPPSSRTLRSAANSGPKNNTRMLQSLFNLSDDSEDDDESDGKSNSKVVVPQSPKERPDESTIDNDHDDPVLIPESQDPCEKFTGKRSCSNTSQPAVKIRVALEEDDDMRIPESPPPLFEMEEAETPTVGEHNSPIRCRGTDFIPTVRSTILNAETIAVSTNMSSKKKMNNNDEKAPESIPSSSGEGSGSTRKRGRDEDQEGENEILQKTKKITLGDINEEFQEATSNGPAIIRPLLNTSRNRILNVSIDSNNPRSGSGRNFKTFQKVLPRFVTKGISASAQQNLTGTSRCSVLNESIKSTRSNIKINLVPKDYHPGETKYYYSDVSRLPPLNPRQEMETNTPPEIQELDNISTRSSGRRGQQRNAGNDVDVVQQTSSISTRNRRGNNAAVPATSPPSKEATLQRRTSPRKKGGSVETNSAILMPPPPSVRKPPPPKPMPMEEDEEDDEWTFNR